jgi:hypothetical protein
MVRSVIRNLNLIAQSLIPDHPIPNYPLTPNLQDYNVECV